MIILRGTIVGVVFRNVWELGCQTFGSSPAEQGVPIQLLSKWQKANCSPRKTDCLQIAI
jgi:hypothetical protein